MRMDKHQCLGNIRWASGLSVGQVDKDSALLSPSYAYSEGKTGAFNVQAQLTSMKFI